MKRHIITEALLIGVIILLSIIAIHQLEIIEELNRLDDVLTLQAEEIHLMEK